MLGGRSGEHLVMPLPSPRHVSRYIITTKDLIVTVFVNFIALSMGHSLPWVIIATLPHDGCDHNKPLVYSYPTLSENHMPVPHCHK